VDTQSTNALRNNPVFIIAIVLAIASVMSGASLLAYYRSDTRKTVDQIQRNNTLKVQKETVAVQAELGSIYIDTLESSITASVGGLSAEVDYNASELTDGALGL
jgi:lipopolysaccharide export LptBFGC system permease protein LptF